MTDKEKIASLEMEVQEWKQLAQDALSGDEMLVYTAFIREKLKDSLEVLESVEKVLLLVDGKPCIESIRHVIDVIRPIYKH